MSEVCCRCGGSGEIEDKGYDSGPFLFVGGSCGTLLLRETREVASFTVTIAGTNGGKSHFYSERYHRMPFECGTEDLVIYVIETMDHGERLRLIEAMRGAFCRRDS